MTNEFEFSCSSFESEWLCDIQTLHHTNPGRLSCEDSWSYSCDMRTAFPCCELATGVSAVYMSWQTVHRNLNRQVTRNAAALKSLKALYNWRWWWQTSFLHRLVSFDEMSVLASCDDAVGWNIRMFRSLLLLQKKNGKKTIRFNFSVISTRKWQD